MVLKNIDKTIVIVMSIAIILPACSSQSSIISKNEMESSIVVSDFQTQSESNADFDNDSQYEDKTTKNNDIKHPDIEKVIITYFDNKEEYTEEQQSFEYIDKIKKCKDVPTVNLISEVGEIRIKYVNKDKPIKYAILYCGSDNGLYAKYVKSKNPDFAFKIK